MAPGVDLLRTKNYFFIMKNSLLGKVRKSGIFSKLALSIAAGFFTFSSIAQTTYTIGTGTATTTNTPISSCYGYTYSQQIYLANDIITAGAGIGTISKIRFYVTSLPASTTSSNNWKVYLGHTAKTAFANTSDWESANVLQSCFTGTVTFPAANNWMEITLSTPFEWDGTSNLIVAIEEEQSGFNCTVNWRGTTGTGNKVIYYRNDSTNPSPASPPTATGVSTTVPNIQLFHTAAPACAGTPAAANTTATVTDVCPTGSTVLGATSTFFEQGMTRQWQMNDGTGWVNVIGATGPTLTQSNLADTMQYQLIATCTNSGLSTSTTPITINLQNLPTVTLNTNLIATCSGEPAELTGSGAATYTWSPATNLSTTSGVTTFATPTANTTYTVTGTSSFGCTNTAQVTVKPVELVKGTLTYDPTVNCTPNFPVTMELNGLPSTITSNGAWEYRWLASDSTTVVQDWNVSNSYTFIPTEDSIYGHFYQIRSTSCPQDYVDSVYTSIAIGFGAEADLTHYDCNTMEGIIDLFSEFGQTALDTVYTDSLNLANSTLTLTGNASFTGGRVELTPSAASKSGSLTVTPANFMGGLNNSLTFSFKMTADMPINNFGTGGGDGMAFSFGDDAVIGGTGPYQNGKGTKLRLSFDAANNANGNVAGIYLTYGFNAADMAPNSVGVLQYSNNVSIWKTQTDVPVTISINTLAQVTVTVGGQVIFNNIQLPASYKTANVSNWKHLFTALTGGDALRHAVKEYTVERNGMVYGITDGAVSTQPTTWQDGSTFDGLLPGTYNVWMSRDTDATCLKNIGTFEILNNNPVVDLGNDTTICAGSTLTLDAGNDGGVYIWSNSNAFTQTIEVTEAGNYVVNVTDTNGCTAIGSVIVNVNELPSANGIYAQGTYPTLSFSLINGQNTEMIDWDFGDGTTLMNGPSSLSHTYTVDGTMIVSATLTNDCGSTEIIDTVYLINDASITEFDFAGLSIYPNPTSSAFNISIESQNQTSALIYDVAGALIQTLEFTGKTTVETNNWNKGVYFIHLSNEGKTNVYKLVVQ